MAVPSMQQERHLAATAASRAAAWPDATANPASRYRRHLTAGIAIATVKHGVKPFHGNSGTRRPTEGVT